jgi:hypothetical protein
MIMQMQSRTNAARVTMVLLVALFVPGCAAAPGILAGIAQGAQLLGHVLDAADVGADRFNARHPDMQRQDDVRETLLRAREAVVALDRALASGSSEEVDRRRRAAAQAYEELYALLEATGILDGTCKDCGGAESESAMPGPLALPRPTEIGEALGGR